jgi:hypothetical protein
MLESPLRRWLRRLGYGLIGLVALIAWGLAALYVITSRDLLKTHRFPDASIPAATNSAGLERDEHLVEGNTLPPWGLAAVAMALLWPAPASRVRPI